MTANNTEQKGNFLTEKRELTATEKRIVFWIGAIMLAFLSVVFVWELVEHHKIDNDLWRQTLVIDQNKETLAKLETLITKMETLLVKIEAEEVEEKAELSVLEKANAAEQAALERVEKAVKERNIAPAPAPVSAPASAPTDNK